jgi:hypothetical protein
MFVNIDRTKFFEFIIPVIPIINTSNSIDMVLEQGRRLELDARLADGVRDALAGGLTVICDA